MNLQAWEIVVLIIMLILFILWRMKKEGKTGRFVWGAVLAIALIYIGLLLPTTTNPELRKVIDSVMGK